MSLQPHNHAPDNLLVADTPEPAVPQRSLGFSLNFFNGRAILSLRERACGPLDLKALELEISHIAFPFDVSGGPERCKNHYCILRHLAFSLSNANLTRLCTDPAARWSEVGLYDLKITLHEGFAHLSGRWQVGDHAAGFSCRTACVLTAPHLLNIVFYDLRLYGWLPEPVALLPHVLWRGLPPALSALFAPQRTGHWEVAPTTRFLRALLPRHGWKLPDQRRAALVAAEISPQQVVIAAGPDSEPKARQLLDRAPPTPAVRVIEAGATFAEAEEALSRGEVVQAFHILRQAVDEDRNAQMARERLLWLGAAPAELWEETRQQANAALQQDAAALPALLALAAIAMGEQAWPQAVRLYQTIAELARSRGERADLIAAELAVATAASHIDTAQALAAYERAAARGRDSVAAHRGLFTLRCARGLWQAAAQAGERLLVLEQDPGERARLQRDLGQIYLTHLSDLKRARMHFERALRAMPQDDVALEGLADTYVARGEPARAAAYLARLAETAERAGNVPRIVDLNLRLGTLWDKWLADPESAAARYRRVLDWAPGQRSATLHLARLAAASNDQVRARSLYEELIATAEAHFDPAAVPDMCSAYTQLGELMAPAAGTRNEARLCWERALELNPCYEPALNNLLALLLQDGDLASLTSLLERAAAQKLNLPAARQARLHLARQAMLHANPATPAHHFLEQCLEVAPADTEALELLLALLAKSPSPDASAAAIERLRQAASAATDPAQRIGLYEQLLAYIAKQAPTPHWEPLRRAALAAILDADPHRLSAARQWVEATCAAGDVAADEKAAAWGRLAIAAVEASERAEALTAQARLLMDPLGRTPEAQTILRQAVAAAPGYVPAWLLLSDLLVAQAAAAGQPPRAAQQLLTEALAHRGSADPQAAILHLRLAAMARSQEEIHAELHHLKQALLSTSPGPAGAHEGAQGPTREQLAQARLRLIELMTEQEHFAEMAELVEAWARQGTGHEVPDADDDSAASHPHALLLKAAQLHRHIKQTAAAERLFTEVLHSAEAQLAHAAARNLEELARERGDHREVARLLELQLGRSETASQPAILLRLIPTLVKLGETEAAEARCQQLLQLDPQAAFGHAFLASRAENHGAWQEALHHYRQSLLSDAAAALSPQTQKQLFARAAALARDLNPELLAPLTAAYTRLHSEPPAEGAWRPALSAILASEQRWPLLVSLYDAQAAAATNKEAKAGFMRQAADILTHHLGQPGLAMERLQQAVEQAPDDTATVATLTALYQERGQYSELAHFLAAISARVTSGSEALAYAVHSSDIFAGTLSDPQAAHNVWRNYLKRPDVDGRNTALTDALRRHELLAELSQVLQRSLEQHPDSEDARLPDLIALLAGPLDAAPAALAWCDRMARTFPNAPTPAQLLVELLRHRPELAQLPTALAALQRVAAAHSGAQQLLGELGFAQGNIDALGHAPTFLEQLPTSDLLALRERFTAAGHVRGLCFCLERLLADPASPPTPAQVWSWLSQAACHPDAGAADPHASAVWQRLKPAELGAPLAAEKHADTAATTAPDSTAAGSGEGASSASGLVVALVPAEARLFPLLLQHISAALERVAQLAPSEALELFAVAARLYAGATPAAQQQLIKAFSPYAGALSEHVAAWLAPPAPPPEPHTAAALWLHLAQLQTAWGDAAAAAQSLLQIDATARDAQWAVLHYRLGVELADPHAQYKGARLVAQLTQQPQERASWLRVAAALHPEASTYPEPVRAWLAEANQIAPMAASWALQHATQLLTASDPQGARCTLEAALAGREEQCPATLWLRLAQACLAEGSLYRCRDALARAQVRLPHEPAWWTELADCAAECGELSLAEQARQKSAELWAERIALDPSATNLTAGLAVARRRRDDPTLAAYAALYAEQLPAQAPERRQALLERVDALVRMGNLQQATATREQLRANGWLRPSDSVALAEALGASAPQEAALLLQQAAADQTHVDWPHTALAAAAASHRAGQIDQARQWLRTAWAHGVNTVEAKRLAVELFDGQERREAAERLLADPSAWATLEPLQQTRLRCYVAESHVLRGEAHKAHPFLPSKEEWLAYAGPRLTSMQNSAEHALVAAHFASLLADAYKDPAAAACLLRDSLVRQPHAALAQALTPLAAHLNPQDLQLRQALLDLAQQSGDFATFAALENDFLERLANSTDPSKLARCEELARIYLQHLHQPTAAMTMLRNAQQAHPQERSLLWSLAHTYALDAAHYNEALALYQQLLIAEPWNSDLLRVLARLAGQLGATDQAYCYYAALLALDCRDEEAKRFVAACRNARARVTKRPLSDADYTDGLLDALQEGPIEELFTPLARFVELALRDDPNRRGIHERDRLKPTDPARTSLLPLLEALGAPGAGLFLWRSGGFACEAELSGTPQPTICLGSALAEHNGSEQRAFLVARTVELYRTGHALCDRLTPTELRELLTALCLAIDPRLKEAGTAPATETLRLASHIGASLTGSIRANMIIKVRDYQNVAAQADFTGWRSAALNTANRVALLLSGDIDEALRALLRLRGFDDSIDEPRLHALHQSEEAMALFRFAVSPAFVILRRRLGLAVPRSG